MMLRRHFESMACSTSMACPTEKSYSKSGKILATRKARTKASVFKEAHLRVICTDSIGSYETCMALTRASIH